MDGFCSATFGKQYEDKNAHCGQGEYHKIGLLGREVLTRLQGSGPGIPSSRSSTPIPAQDSPSGDRIIDDEKILQHCALAMQDINEMDRAVWRLWNEHIRSILPQNIADDDQANAPESEPFPYELQH